MNIALKTRSYSALLAALGVTAAFAGCDRDLLTESPPHILVVDNLYTSKSGFQQALNALYAQARNERLGRDEGPNGLRAAQFSLGTDVAWSPYREPFTDTFNNYGLFMNPQRAEIQDVWNWLYRTINGANTVIDRSTNEDVEWTDAERDAIVAEARLFRAWAYRHLTYLWGDVPLNLTESTGANIRSDWERAPRAEVRRQMEEDLLFAEANLPVTAPDGRLTRAVASHYLAELYLALDQPAKAEAEARKVTESGQYRLITARYGVAASAPGTPFTDQFLDGNVNRSQGNTEAIWTFNFEANAPGGGLSIMRRNWVNRYYSIKGVSVTAANGGRGIGRIGPTAWAVKLYSPGDDRGSQYAIRYFYIYDNPAGLPKGKQLGDTVWLNKTTQKANDMRWVSIRKWDGVNPLDPDGNYNVHDQPYIRVAETYLLLAEAQLEQGNAAGAAATINVLRTRAHAPQVVPGDITLDFILDERARELLGEEQRRHTLVRTQKLVERTQKYNPMSKLQITPRDTVFPIPQSAIDANIGHAMPQNPGY